MIRVLIKGNSEEIKDLEHLVNEFKAKGIEVILSDKQTKLAFDYIFLLDVEKPFLEEKEYHNRCKELYIGVHSKYTSDKHNVFSLEAPIRSMEISTLMNKILLKRNIPYKLPVNMNLLKDIDFKTNCDLFVKINDDKYIKVFKKDDNLTKEDIQKYIDKGSRAYYVEQKDYIPFVSSLFEEKQEYINDLLNELLIEVGITQTTIKLLDEMSKMITNDLKKSPLNFLLKKITERKDGDYAYNHSYLIALVSAEIGKRMEFSFDLIQKLIIVSFIHDVAIEKRELVYMHDMEESSLTTLFDDDLKMVNSHQTKLADLLSLDETMDIDIISMVKNHHSKPFQDSYKTSKPFSQLKRIECVFNVVHFYVVQLYKMGFNVNQLNYIHQVLENEYKKDKYAMKIVKELKDLKII